MPLKSKKYINKLTDTLTDKNLSLWGNDSMEEIASYINTGKLNPDFLYALKNKRIAPKDILIDERHYTSIFAGTVSLLLELFPRTIPFSFETAKLIIEKERDLFLGLPLENQADIRLFRFAVHNTIPVSDGWGTSEEPDRRNISISKINPAVLDYIKQDEDGVYLALTFIQDNVVHRQHPNVQKLMNNRDFYHDFYDGKKSTKKNKRKNKV